MVTSSIRNFLFTPLLFQHGLFSFRNIALGNFELRRTLFPLFLTSFLPSYETDNLRKTYTGFLIFLRGLCIVLRINWFMTHFSILYPR